MTGGRHTSNFIILQAYFLQYEGNMQGNSRFTGYSLAWEWVYLWASKSVLVLVWQSVSV